MQYHQRRRRSISHGAAAQEEKATPSDTTRCCVLYIGWASRRIPGTCSWSWIFLVSSRRCSRSRQWRFTFRGNDNLLPSEKVTAATALPASLTTHIHTLLSFKRFFFRFISRNHPSPLQPFQHFTPYALARHSSQSMNLNWKNLPPYALVILSGHGIFRNVGLQIPAYRYKMYGGQSRMSWICRYLVFREICILLWNRLYPVSKQCASEWWTWYVLLCKG